MASVSAVRTGLADRLKTIDKLRVWEYVPGDVVPDAAVISPLSIEYDSTMARGSDDLTFLIQLAVSKSWERTAQDRLDAYLAGSGDRSIKAAVESEKTLGGVVHFARVARVDNYGDIEVAQTTMWGANITIEVTASGS